MNRTITITGARGGQGASTFAAALAVLAARRPPPHHADQRRARRGSRHLGHPPTDRGDTVEVTPTLTLAETPAVGTEITVVDLAPAATPFPRQPEGDHYAGLRDRATWPWPASWPLLRPPTASSWSSEDGRSLTARDVTEVTGVPVVATIRAGQAVARTIEGLLLARLHHLREFKTPHPHSGPPLRRLSTRLSIRHTSPHRPPLRTRLSTPSHVPQQSHRLAVSAGRTRR
ncbi:MAG TPA: hypothetical protein VM142_09085 [Acidimicrobiales bacterium]|nr:hypothetical protein [Acidimicrobiales bacterium]